MTRSHLVVALLFCVAVFTACTHHTSTSRNNTAPSREALALPNAAKGDRVQPRWMKEDAEERQEARERTSKFLQLDRHRATPELRNLEGSRRFGPTALEDEKVATRSAPGKGLLLEGAAIGRREIARIAGFEDADSDKGRPWASIGPTAATYPVATSRTNAPYITSGRITALAIDPRCGVAAAPQPEDDEDSRCSLYVGAAGGGVWVTHRPFSATPKWKFVSGSFATNAIGTLAISPSDPDVIYAGTGEPNASSD